jgi:hypothetical protein
MSAEIKDFTDARVRARRFVKERYPRVKRIYLGRTWRENEVWIVEVEVKVKTGVFSTVKERFRLQISAETGEIERSETKNRQKILKRKINNFLCRFDEFLFVAGSVIYGIYCYVREFVKWLRY